MYYFQIEETIILIQITDTFQNCLSFVIISYTFHLFSGLFICQTLPITKMFGRRFQRNFHIREITIIEDKLFFILYLNFVDSWHFYDGQ